MTTQPKRIFQKTVAITALFCLTTQSVFANVLLSLSPVPLTVSNIPPQVMLTITKDQQLFKKAYNDYSDLNGDGRIDTTYDHKIEYYGYFDPFKCYEYKAGVFEPKELAFIKTTVKVNGKDVTKYLPDVCKSGSVWNGNFLNWVSMSRIDAVRKLLYGGLRYVDETFDAAKRPVPVTVLERAYIPTDAHAWAKYYLPDPSLPDNQPSIDKLTPFKPATTVKVRNEKTTAPFLIPVTLTSVDVAMNFNGPFDHIQPGDQVRIQQRNSGANGPRFVATITGLSNGGKRVDLRVHAKGISGVGSFDDWDVTNLSSTGISFCNFTPGVPASGDANEKSQTNVNPPLIRVAEGNFALWNANERAQCMWFNEANNRQSGFAAGVRSNGNQSALSSIEASAENPVQSVHGPAAGSEFIVRVKVCDPKVFDRDINAEKCKTYPNGNLKPIGLLQEYGDNDRFHFGLMTGSYAKNVSGGVLRKNIGSLTDEVRTDSDGVFREASVAANGTVTYRDHPYRPRPWPAATIRAANAEESPPGIINTLNYMRVYGYRSFMNGGNLDGDYVGGAADNCTYQLISLDENSCTSWGNPISEIFFEAVRYFAGQTTPTKEYTFTNSGSKDNVLGLPLAKFKDPLSKANYCAPLNLLVINAAVADNELLDDAKAQTDLRTVSGADINASSSTMADLTNKVGALEGLTGGAVVSKYFVGKIVGSAATPASAGDYELCSPKDVTALGDVSGICPEGATGGGSYLISGIAHHAKTNQIRTDLKPLVLAGDTKSLTVSTYGIQLASNTPQLEIDVSPKSDGSKRIVIQPIYRLDRTAAPNAPNGKGAYGGGGLVDMRYVSALQTTGNIRSGKVYVNWEDSEQGGDYDQDMWGTIEWTIDLSKGTVTVTTNAVSASTANPQGFGYSISGTKGKDGPHFHSGIYGFNFGSAITGLDPTGVKGCVNCRLVGEVAISQSGETSAAYDIADASSPPSAGKLQDPLWYASKYGGFTDENNDKIPNALALNPLNLNPAPSEWDKENNATGDLTPDGIPDSYFLVTNPLGLVAALTRAFNKAAENSSGSAVMANSTSLSTTNRIYQARYDPSTWSGHLLAKEVKPDGTIVAKEDWDAALKLDAAVAGGPGNRVIWTFDDDKKKRIGTLFEKGGISKNLKNLLDISPITGVSDGKSDERLEFLRGDRSTEGAKGGAFRTRGSVLGDIVSSDPAYVGAPNANQIEHEYGVFREKWFTRTPMLYVGANDGMLHGFDATTGEETMAYVPSKTFPHLAKLTSPVYSHRYYVDGAPQTADVELGAAKDWRTVLVGGMGGGGQGLFALDVTNPGGVKGSSSEFTKANADKNVLWEFTDDDDPDLGYVYGKPLIRKMSNGKWATIVSGGYNNKEGDASTGTGKAFLFIIFMDGPTGTKADGTTRVWQLDRDYIKIEAVDPKNANVPDATAANGLAPPFAADTDADGTVNFIYAGDLQGNFWKFDVSDKGNVVPGWKDKKVILFKAVDAKGNKQPITSQAEGTLHPSKPGFILVFGTGKYLETSDTLPAFATQSYYGLWDKNDNKDVTAQTVITNRSQLFGYEIQVVDPYRIVVPEDASLPADSGPDWSKNLGYRMDFPDSDKTGERVVFRPLLLSSRLIFTTLMPSEDPCAGGGTSFLMIINPTTGGAVDAAVFNVTDADPKVVVLDATDKITDSKGNKVFASGIKSTVGIAPTPVVVKGGPTTGSGTSASSQIYGSKAPYIAGPESLLGYTFLGGPLGISGVWIGLSASSGRVSWREVLPN